MARGGASPAEYSDGAILFAGGYAVSRGTAKEGGRPGTAGPAPWGGGAEGWCTSARGVC